MPPKRKVSRAAAIATSGPDQDSKSSPRAGSKRKASSTGASPPSAKRGRGRPKKAQTTIENTLSDAEEAEIEADEEEDEEEEAKEASPDDVKATSSTLPVTKRGRGRPKKAQTTIEESMPALNDSKGAKAAAELDEEEETPPTLPTAKRGRGRPKKVQKAVEETMPGVDDAEEEEMGEDEKNAKPSSSLPTTKRGRGRPKNAQMNVEESFPDADDAEETVAGGKMELEVEEEEEETDDVSLDDVKTSPPSLPNTKRGRGRPKQTQKNLEETMPQSDVNGKKEAPTDSGETISPTAKRGRGRPKKVQKSDETKDGEEEAAEAAEDVEMGNTTKDSRQPAPKGKKETKRTSNGTTQNKVSGAAATAKIESAQTDEHDAKDSESTENGKSIEVSEKREESVPSNIIEKGIVYFLTRARVGIENPDSVSDLQRGYFVLRPLPKGAKIGEGAIEDSNTNRLFALPKKSLPKSGSDKFMAFVEKAKVTMKELKEQVFQSSEYETKTMGARVTPAISPIGEGVYALTKTGNTTHLAYMLTIPEKVEEVQNEMGIRERGSFVISLKNPTKKGPSYATLDEKPDFPQAVIEDFNDLAWMPIHKAAYLDYANAQILLIGEDEDKFDAAIEFAEKHEVTNKNKKDDEQKETAKEELQKLNDEDHARIEHLNGDDTVFDDLHISQKEYGSLLTTW